MKSSNTEAHPFTKGPWAVNKGSKALFCIDDENGAPIADIDTEYVGGRREAVGNANLSAAAPELLQALKSALGSIYELDELTGWSRQELRDQYKNAVSVIDRATGKHQEGNAQ